MRASLLFVLFLAAAAAAQTFSTEQETNVSFVFHAPEASSVFVQIPPGWTAPKTSSAFSCPADWIRDAEYTNYVHCACAAPCASLLDQGAIVLATQAPNVSGNYSWKVLAYDLKGTLVSNTSNAVQVQTRPRLNLVLKLPTAMLTDFPTVLSAQLSNSGQAAAKKVHFSLKALTIQGEDVTEAFSFETPREVLVAGGESFDFNLTLQPVSAKKGTYSLSLGGAGADDNSNDTVRATAAGQIQVFEGANVGVLSLQAPNRLSEGQGFNATILLKNEGGVPAGRVNVSLIAQNPSGRAVIGSNVADEVGVLGIKPVSVTGKAQTSGSYLMTVEISYLEAISDRIKSTESQTPLSKSTLEVETPAQIRLSSSADVSEPFTNDNFTVKILSAQPGQATLADGSLRLEKTIGGCDLVGILQKNLGALPAGANLSTEWTFSTPPIGGLCKLFFQAKGLDSNSRQTVESSVLVVEIPIRARELARLQAPGVTFFQKDGQWFVSRPVNGSGWNLETGPNSRLELLVEQVSKRQDALEARLKSLQVRLEASADDLPTGSKHIHSELLVDLLKPPAPESSLDFQILPATAQNLPDTKVLGDVGLKNPLAVVKVDKTRLVNKEDIDTATLILELDKGAVDAVGGPESLRMVRDDDGSVTLIPVRLLSSTETKYRFEAFSEQGLSLFALYAVEQAVPEEKPRGITGEVVLSQFYTKGYAAILFVVVLVGAFVAIRYRDFSRPSKKGVTHYDAPKEPPKRPDLPPWEKHKIDKAKKGLDDV